MTMMKIMRSRQRYTIISRFHSVSNAMTMSKPLLLELLQRSMI